MDQIRAGSKVMPLSARQFVSDIFSNSIKYKQPEKGLILGKTFCTVEIDELEFDGIGDSADEAREAAALNMLKSYLNLKFLFD